MPPSNGRVIGPYFFTYFPLSTFHFQLGRGPSTCGARRLARSPAFTLAAVLTLALAIGANASIFAVVQRVLLTPLPYPDSDRVIDLDHGGTPNGRNVPTGIQMTPGLFYEYLDRARTLEGVALYRTDEQTLTDGGEPERIRIARVTPSLASVLQAWPSYGRWFAQDEGAQAPYATPRVSPDTPQVAVLSYRLWKSRYGGDPSILSRSVTLGGSPTEIVGVMPPLFAFPDPRVDVWIPEQVRREPVWDTFMHTGIARLRPGVDGGRRPRRVEWPDRQPAAGLSERPDGCGVH